MRLIPPGSMFDQAGCMMFSRDNAKLNNLMAFVNSPIASQMLDMINPTLNCPPGVMSLLPMAATESIPSVVSDITDQLIEFAKSDYDSFETSWDFKRHPLV